MRLASVTCFARSHVALAALDHVLLHISDLLDVSVLYTPPQAAAMGFLALFERVMERVDTSDVDPILRFHWLGMALQKAIERGHFEIVQAIHKIHPSPLAVQSFKIAATAGQLHILQWLCDHRYDRLCIDGPPNQYDPHSIQCCFHFQCVGDAKLNKHFHVLRWLYETGYIQNMEGVGDIAATEGDFEMVKWLHEGDFHNAFTSGAIDGAARQGHLAIVQFLHENRSEGACVRTFMGAMVAGHLDVVEYFKSREINSVVSPETIISMACTSGRVDLLEEFSAFLDDDHSREQALDEAIGHGQLEVAKWLGKHPVSTTALANAAADGYMDVLQWVHAQDCGVWRPEVIAQAAAAGHLSIVQWAFTNRNELLTAKVLDGAAAGGQLHVLQWLHEHTAARCSSDAMGDAAANGHFAVVKWLHEQSVEVTSDCLDGAARHGHLELLMWLVDHGYDRISADATPCITLDTFMWLHQRFAIPVDAGAVIRAIALGDLQFMKWIHANTQLRVSPRLVRFVLPMSHPHMIEWMREHRPDEFIVTEDNADDPW